MKRPRHFLTLLDFTTKELRTIISRASVLKAMLKQGKNYRPFIGKTLAMIFEKSSTRTRVSFEAGIAQMGGHALFLSPRDIQLSRGEAIEDTARVLSLMVDIIMIRTFEHKKIIAFAKNAFVPVINGLTNQYHPCQLLADIETWFESRGEISGINAVWIGDGNNMCHSYINAAKQFDFKLNIACPKGFEPDNKILALAGANCQIIYDPMEASRNVDLIITDVWTSMGYEEEKKKRESIFLKYQVTTKIMAMAHKDALFMHCLPAHRGKEVTTEVIDGPQSVVWEAASNRMHAQKALMEFLLLQ